MRFLFRWQHVQPGTQLSGRDGLLEVIGQLQGAEVPAPAWEAHILPARIRTYDPADLDALCLSGAVTWGRLLSGQAASMGDGSGPESTGSGRRWPGEQFALPEAVEALRAIRRGPDETQDVVLSAADPLNLIGVLLPGIRVSPLSGLAIALRNGVPMDVAPHGALLARLRGNYA